MNLVKVLVSLMLSRRSMLSNVLRLLPNIKILKMLLRLMVSIHQKIIDLLEVLPGLSLIYWSNKVH
jgi:hypothetical protein